LISGPTFFKISEAHQNNISEEGTSEISEVQASKVKLSDVN
jgi:hypothetical protein